MNEEINKETVENQEVTEISAEEQHVQAALEEHLDMVASGHSSVHGSFIW